MGNSASRAVYVPPKQPQITAATHENFKPSEIVGVDWYEIARLKNDFEKDCNSVAHIVSRVPTGFLLSSGCYGKDGLPISEKQGRLYTPNPNDPSKMQLQYPGWFGGKPIDFWVYDMDLVKGYLVIGNQQGMGWILSNKNTMSWCTVYEVLQRMEKRGFNIDPENVWFKWKPLTKC